MSFFLDSIYLILIRYPMKLHIRPATLDDAECLFLWRNDEETRRNSINTDPVERESHVGWLTRSLTNSARKLYIVEADGIPAGTVRTDILNDGAYELSWTVAPEARGKGIGKAMLVQFKQEVLPEARIVATIQDGNVASEKIAQALGKYF